MTPYEMWYGQIHLVRNLGIFGSIYYALIPKEQRSKLDVMSRKCIFLGYSDTTKAYCLYDEVNMKFILSRDLIFLNILRMAMLLSGSLIVWIYSNMQSILKSLIVRFRISFS